MTTELPDYNGWSNYFTWAVYRWLTNDEATYNHALDIAQTSERGIDCDAAIKEYVESGNPLTETTTLYTDLLNYALTWVDWREISNALAEPEDKKRWEEARSWTSTS